MPCRADQLVYPQRDQRRHERVNDDGAAFVADIVARRRHQPERGEQQQQDVFKPVGAGRAEVVERIEASGETVDQAKELPVERLHAVMVTLTNTTSQTDPSIAVGRPHLRIRRRLARSGGLLRCRIELFSADTDQRAASRHGLRSKISAAEATRMQVLLLRKYRPGRALFALLLVGG